MNTMKTITMTLAMAAFFVISARGQGFLNLDFESAQNLPGNPGNGELVSTVNALPGWTAYDGDYALPNINYVSNYISGVATTVELEGGSLALSENLSVGLYGNSSISQTGMVPEDAASLEFEAYGVPGPSGFSVTLGGQKLSFTALSEDSNYDVLYGANIPSSMDGQLEALIFGCQGVGSGNVLLDNIEFSSMGVPEPSEYALLGLGAVLFGFWRQRKTAADG
jgi:hypothetical protein